MAKSSNQKQKLLCIMQFFLEETDENHAATMTQILSYLGQKGMDAERKSVYADMDALRDFGMEIEGYKEGENYYYHLVDRKFELAELKLLVDAVQSSKFLTIKKSNELIHKIEKSASRYEAKELQRQVFVTNRIKTMNESIYYNVDELHTAIGKNCRIRFQYFNWGVDKTMRLRKNGTIYEISPWALSWDNENYYLIGYDSEAKMIKHYRVDKMLHIELTNQHREGKEYFKQFDTASYARKVFGMFGGEEETVELTCANEMAGVMIDRFGKDTMFVPKDETHFKAIVKVEVSSQFFGWIFSLDGKVKIAAPKAVANKMKHAAQAFLEEDENTN